MSDGNMKFTFYRVGQLTEHNPRYIQYRVVLEENGFSYDVVDHASKARQYLPDIDPVDGFVLVFSLNGNELVVPDTTPILETLRSNLK